MKENICYERPKWHVGLWDATVRCDWASYGGIPMLQFACGHAFTQITVW